MDIDREIGEASELWTIDGRHRVWVARQRDVKEMRADVHHPGGVQLRVVPVSKLVDDPAVQLAHTFNEKHARKILAEYDPDKVGVIKVCLPDGLSVARRAEIKYGNDGVRRNVRALEHFQMRCMWEDRKALDISHIANGAGWEIGGAKNHPARLECVVALDRTYTKLGGEGLREVLTIAANWRGEPKANTSAWLLALALLQRDGYFDVMTASQRERLLAAVPAQVERQARGILVGAGAATEQGSSEQWGALAYQIASVLRKKCRMRSRPKAEGHHQSRGI